MLGIITDRKTALLCSHDHGESPRVVSEVGSMQVYKAYKVDLLERDVRRNDDFVPECSTWDSATQLLQRTGPPGPRDTQEADSCAPLQCSVSDQGLFESLKEIQKDFCTFMFATYNCDEERERLA